MMLGILAFLPLAPLVLLAERKLGNWRAAIVAGFLAWSALAYGMAEGLGALSLLHRVPVLAVWVLVNGALAIAAGWSVRRSQRSVSLSAPRGVGALVFGLLAVLLGLTLARTLLAPPNTFDVLNYHLPRQLMWLQQGNLDFFPTRNDRMLMMPPLAELLQLHAMALSGGDHWANLPQWLAYAVGIVVVSLLAREAGGRRNAQWIGALLFATLPMAYHQASSAKNDLLLAAYVACSFWLALRCRRHARKPLGWIGLGLTSGLGLATKSTAVLWLLPVALAVFPAAWRNRRLALWALVLALLIPAPHAMRNLAWYGTPLGIHRADDGGAQVCELISWRAGVSNAARNLGLHLVSPWPLLNKALDSSIEGIHRWIGSDPQDRRTTLWNLPYALAWAPTVELVTGAPLHVLLGLPCLMLLAMRWRRMGGPCRLVLALFAAEVLLLCLFLKWQQWGARLQIPHFILLAALSAVLLGEGRTWRALLWCGVVAIAWIPFAETRVRPLFLSEGLWNSSRWENYFRSYPPERQAQESCLEALRAAGNGIVQVDNIHGFPYPMMKRLRDEQGMRFRMGEESPGTGSGAPQAILAYTAGRTAPLYREIPGAPERYRAVGETKLWIVYLQETRARNLARLGTPAFIGWTGIEGLGDWVSLSRNGSAEFLREIPAKGAVLDYAASGAHLRLQLVLLNLGGPCLLTVRHAGLSVAKLPIAACADWQYAEIPIDAASGTERRIALKPVLDDADKFGTRLYAVRLRVIEDPQPSP
ncbi:MAG: glycosyltransferase family 39 protein [Opitutaceae bacterium]|jgi:hypothetical protein